MDNGKDSFLLALEEEMERTSRELMKQAEEGQRALLDQIDRCPSLTEGVMDLKDYPAELLPAEDLPGVVL